MSAPATTHRLRRATATAAACSLVIAAAAGGCGGEGAGEPEGGAPGQPPEGATAPAPSEDEQVIRAWNDAVNAGDYDRAADLFAPGAIVQQIVETRLRTHADAVDFNSGLPCRADVTDLREEDDGSTVAAFSLREGPTGECREGGSASVRFVIRDGEIEEWRQLPGAAPQAPRGDTA